MGRGSCLLLQSLPMVLASRACVTGRVVSLDLLLDEGLLLVPLHPHPGALRAVMSRSSRVPSPGRLRFRANPF